MSKRAERAALMADGHLACHAIGRRRRIRDQVPSSASASTSLPETPRSGPSELDGRRSLQPRDDSAMRFSGCCRLVWAEELADDAPVDHALFDDPRGRPSRQGRGERRRRRARSSQSQRNHYVDASSTRAGAIWVGVHFAVLASALDRIRFWRCPRVRPGEPGPSAKLAQPQQRWGRILGVMSPRQYA